LILFDHHNVKTVEIFFRENVYLYFMERLVGKDDSFLFIRYKERYLLKGFKNKLLGDRHKCFSMCMHSCDIRENHVTSH
jgi:hypothetical protein